MADAFAAGARSVAFATIGDPNIYSTFTYLAATVRALVPGLAVATVPGITAMQSLAASSGTVLVEGRESLALMPLTAGVDKLRAALARRTTPSSRTRAGACCPRCSTPYAAPGGCDGAVVGSALGMPGRGHPATPQTSIPSTARRTCRRCWSYPSARGAGQRAVTGRGKVVFVGAGPGAADLLTLRAAAAIGAADVVIWASSLVQEEVLQPRPAGRPDRRFRRRCTGSRRRALRGSRGATAAPSRVSTPAIRRSGERCRSSSTGPSRSGLDVEVIPGVSSFSAAAAAIGRELTIPEVAQSVILTRLEGGKTPMPPRESVREFARHGTTMALFLSAARSGQLQEELLAGGYAPETPCVVAYRVTWEDELIVRCRLAELTATVREHKLWKHTLVLVGPALEAGGTRSHLYHPGHFHGFRRADPGGPPAAAGRRQPAEWNRPKAAGASRARPAPHDEGQGPGAAHRLDHRHVQRGRRKGRQHCTFQRHRSRRRRHPAARRRSDRRSPVDSPCEVASGRATAVVVKDAGDDPDVTHGARLTATVAWRATPGIELDGGVGVGVVTKPGLGLEVGGPAINPVPAGTDRASRR